MKSLNPIKNFIAQKNIAVVGVSSSGKGFGTAVYKHLKNNNYNVFPININGGLLDQQNLYKDLYEIDHPVDAVVTVVPPSETEKVVRDAIKLGIKNIWMQQGSESNSAIEYCKQNNADVVHGECILMFAEPVKSIHSFHRWIWKLIGKYPS